MKSTKKIAVCGILSAIGTIILFIGGLLGVLDISAACIVSFIVLFCSAEIGLGYGFAVYVIISVISFLICGNNLFAPICFAALFGPMAATKFIFDKAGKIFGTILKIALPLALLTVGWIFFSELLELPENKWLSAMYFGLSMIIALLTQKLYTLMTRQYILRRRDKVRKLLR